MKKIINVLEKIEHFMCWIVGIPHTEEETWKWFEVHRKGK